MDNLQEFCEKMISGYWTGLFKNKRNHVSIKNTPPATPNVTSRVSKRGG